MNSRITLPALTLIAFLILGVGQANATFPGKNGRIAFVQGDIFTMNPDGSDVRQLTNVGPESVAFWESWSPDGKRIAYNPLGAQYRQWKRYRGGSVSRVWIYDVDSHEELDMLLARSPVFNFSRTLGILLVRKTSEMAASR